MTSVDLTLEIDSNARDIDFCQLEKIKFEPKQTSFQFKDGKWVATHKSFPIDDALDLMIIISGNPGTTSVLKVIIDGKAQTFKPQQDINEKGYTYFRQKIQLPIPVL